MRRFSNKIEVCGDEHDQLLAQNPLLALGGEAHVAPQKRLIPANLPVNRHDTLFADAVIFLYPTPSPPNYVNKARGIYVMCRLDL